MEWGLNLSLVGTKHATRNFVIISCFSLVCSTCLVVTKHKMSKDKKNPLLDDEYCKFPRRRLVQYPQSDSLELGLDLKERKKKKKKILQYVAQTKPTHPHVIYLNTFAPDCQGTTSRF